MFELSDLSGVTIVICTYNGKPRLEKTLIHALRQSTSFPYEVLVVDNASSDGTANWVSDFAKRHNALSIIRIVQEEKPGLSHARIRGVKEARYSLILFCDDDNWLASDYLEIGKRSFEKHPKLGALGGEGIPVFESEKPEWFDQFSHSYAVGDLGMKSGILPKGSAVYGAGCFFRKSALNQLFELGWNSILSDRKGDMLFSGGDVEFCYVIQLLGYDVGFEKSLKFYHFLEDRRLKWDYYLQLKRGITSGTGLLFTYQYFFESSSHLSMVFKWVYFKETLKAGLLYLKYKILWKGNPSIPADQLAYMILKTKYTSFKENRKKAIPHFKQICRYFET